jgi:Lipase maturation factor
VLFNHLCELALPWFVFGPRLARLIAGCCMVAFQLTLIASGNLAFLNWLTVIPVIACFDDDFWAWLLPRRLATAFTRARPTFEPRPRLGHTIAAVAFALVVGVLSQRVVDNLFFARHQDMNASYDRFDAVGTYGAFGSVGDDRLELILEGTRDDDPNTARWIPYELPCKPGDVLRRPCTLGPYHHRLDWLLWFAAMEHQPDESGTERGIPEADPWVVHLVWKLLHADPWARTLLADDPFGDDPPRWIRIELYRYQFAPLGDRAWWTRTLVGEWLPPVSIDDDWLLDFLDGHGWSTTYERAPLDLP